MAQLTYQSPPASDASNFDSLARATQRIGIVPEKVTVRIQVASGNQEETFQLEQSSGQPLVEAVRATPTLLWHRLTFAFKSGEGGESLITVTRQNGWDEVGMTIPDSHQPKRTMQVAQALAEEFPRTFSAATALNRALGPELADFYQRREVALLRLEELSQRLTEETHTYRLQLEREAQERSVRDAETLKSKTDTLEEEFSKKNDALSARESQLAEAKAQFDDRSARHVRRDSVKGLKGIISRRGENFALTRDTQKKRWVIHLIFVVLLGVSATVLAFGLFQQPAQTEQGAQLWLHLLRIPAGALGFAFAAVFYIRWNDHWFRQHADEEFRLRQLELDIDRASWVTELALEFRDEQGNLPAALLDRLSAGLFVSRSSEGVRHPTQDILSTIIGASSRLKLTLPGGIEADVSKGGIKKVTDELNKSGA